MDSVITISFPIEAILAFIAGLLSCLSPCTLPILPAYFAFTFQSERTGIVKMTTAFFIGLALVFVLLGASASYIGSLLNEHIRTLTQAGGVLIILFGLMSLSGKGFTGYQTRTRPVASTWGSLLFGATFAFGWTACIGPILGGLLVLAASDATVYQGAILLFIYAMGLGLPLILVSALIGRKSRDSLPWRILRGKAWIVHIGSQSLYLHSTSIVSGLLYMGMGYLMLTGTLTRFNRLVPADLQVWFLAVEESLRRFLGG
ncbi:MAG: cytochrome c biogenesis protein CcdA [Chloroflexi bacterium]|nr:cytochrome c biogenesis protein CcdA [Chloroflexota bacterium]